MSASALVAGSLLLSNPTAHANPAPDAGLTSLTPTLDFTQVVPEGVCSVDIILGGGDGGSAISGTPEDPDPDDPDADELDIVGGTRGNGARITLSTIEVSPGQQFTGSIGGVGGNGGAAGLNGGGAGSGAHAGGGGGGYTELFFEGTVLALAGGGGGTGGGHLVDWGWGGNAGVPEVVGEVADGSPGRDGSEDTQAQINANDGVPPSPQPGGGGAGTGTGPGAGGVHPDFPARDGLPGDGRAGGAGGNAGGFDTGGGGGGGFFGGGGGADTQGDGVGGAGGGGGSSIVYVPFEDARLKNPSAEDGDGNPNPDPDPFAGFVNFQWNMCEYDLALTKSSGAGVFEIDVPVEYTLTIENLGPEIMTIGDTVTVTDTVAGGGTLTGVSSSDGNDFVCDPEVGEEIPGSGIIHCFQEIVVPADDPLDPPTVLQRGLDVGEVLTITYTQTFTEGDEPIENTASIEDRGDPDNNVAAATVDPADPSLDLVKSANPNSIDFAGQEITYSFEVTNTGNIAIFDIVIVEGDFSGTGTLGDPVCPDHEDGLAPEDSITCVVTYTATQADVDAGEITNSAVAGGVTPGGNPVISDPSAAEIAAVHAPALELEKTADPETLTRTGEIVTFTFALTNTGNVTLYELEVIEGEFSGTGELSDIVCPEEPLAPGNTADCFATYSVTGEDVDAGFLTNTATASAVSPSGVAVLAAPSTAVLELALPATGADIALFALGLGLALLLAGGIIVVTVRRQNNLALA